MTFHHFIDGQAVSAANGRFGDVYNPATGEIAGQVPFAGPEQVGQAVAAAEAALPKWAATPPIQRARVMFRFKALIEAHMDELAETVSAEHGKTLEDARGSITRGVEVVEFACGIPHLLKGEFTEAVGTGVDSYSMRQPVGVCAGITPFNFPAMVPMWMFPIAIACGNTFVLKPSERDPSCPLRLARLLQEAGCPDGVLNVVNGDKEAVDALLTDPRVAAVSFVGSTPIAEYVYATASAHGKRAQALGGAKNHMVVMPDADLDQATDALMGAAYGSAGERCMAVSVAVAVGDAAEPLIKKLAPRVQGLKIGPYTDSAAEMGPLVTRQALDRVKALVDSGVEQGAELIVDGRGETLQGYENGYFMGGCLFDKVEPEMEIYKQEIFGPVLSVVRAADYDSALDLVVKNPYGNGTAIFTRDGDAARDFASRANIGMVGVNVPIPVPVAYHSFGGWKRSLFGQSNVHGSEGVRFYTRTKTVTARWPSGIRQGADYSIPTLR
ncbi:MAG: CoA-acylating methylmalonate-semialdehyde dehydrogenase [Alphaproteobacteria bacterium]|nr:CoA-acylating methylmalonate-semialdehyde dehydrogenase [Alphaproteobacteria bacterium]MDP6516741.1 CoA-acylating methylmalonate-semialdehyde dehydrogenase [Alphaproteobacteria bacterium]